MKPPHSGDIQNIKLAIGFSIDSSGSMAWNDPQGLRKQTAKEFVDKLDDDDKAAVIDFDFNATVLCPLTSDKEEIKRAIDQIDSSGGTNLSVGIQAAIDQLKNDPSDAKYIIMLTDGVGSYNHALTQQAKDLGIVIYTIGLGYDLDENLLRRIANETGGKYYHASTNADLREIFDETSEETVELAKDTDGDGLSDYHEKRGMRTNTGKWIYTDPYNADTDGDGLLDGEELIYKDTYFLMKSNPNKKDSDGDGILDRVDPEPMVYNITDRTLALAAGLSYTNLASSVGKTVGSKGEPELSAFRIVHANNSGYLTLNDFFDRGLGSVAIRISRSGKKDAIIFAFRGTEFKDDAIRDGLTDIFLALGPDSVQSEKAFIEYQKLVKKYPNADFFLAGHSLGGRLVQDVLYKVYDANDGIFGYYKSNIKTPVHSSTFNALGYNKQVYFTKWLFKEENIRAIDKKLYNYYYKYDFVGEGLGNSMLFQRLGTDIGPWTAKDKNGKVIDSPKIPGLDLIFSAVHGIDLFYYDNSITYPNVRNTY